MGDVTVTVKYKGETVVKEAEFDERGVCVRAVDKNGKEYKAGDSGGEPFPRGEINYRMNLEMIRTNPCCWMYIGGVWVCLEC